MKTHERKWVQAAIIGTLCSVAVALCYHFDLLETLEFKTLDHRFRSMPLWASTASPADIAIVVIDQSSIEYVNTTLGQRWPWPREFYGRLITLLDTAGARAIIFDIFFSEPDIERQDVSGMDSDQALCDATRAASNVFHSCVLQRMGQAPLPEQQAMTLAKARFPGQIEGPLALKPYTTGALPISQLAQAARGVGFATVVAETDNICRRIPLLAAFADEPVMSQALAAGWELLGTPPMSARDGTFRIGGQSIPTDASTSAFLWWYRPAHGTDSPYPHYSAFELLRASVKLEHGKTLKLPLADFKDKIVYIGSTAPSLFDNWATPLSRAVPGVEIQATALANLLRNDYVTRLQPIVTYVAILLLCMTVAQTTCVSRRHAALSMLIPLVLLVAAVATGYGQLASRHRFVDLVPPTLAIVLTFGVATITNYLTERRHSKMVRGIFEHYLDSTVVDNLIANPEQVRLGGEKRECTVLFTDVANFTNTSEQLGPEQVVHFMNVYLNAMTDIIISEGGFVDKFIGDEVIAIFGAPNTLPDHAERACRAILRMREKVEELQPQFREAGCKTAIFARTGMSTGSVVIGNMGSDTRMNYTAMGNTMNLGARIQGICKVYGTRILVSESTAEAARTNYVFREIDVVQVKGKERGERIFELLGTREHPDLPDDTRRQFEVALALYRDRQWKAAEAAFQALAAAGDPPSQIFLERCVTYAQTPPPSDWNGLYVMVTK